MAVNLITFTHGRRLDKDDFNQISANATNGFSGASAGDSIHPQYMGNQICDQTKFTSGYLRSAQSANLTFTNTPTAFGWFKVISKTTTTVTVKLYYSFGGPTSVSFGSDNYTLTWGTAFHDTAYFPFFGLFKDGANFKIEAVGIRPADTGIS